MKYILQFMLLFSALAGFGQQGGIKGKVKTSDGKPASFVNAGLKGSSKGSTANNKGEFEIKGIDPGHYTLVISFIGLETKEMEVDVQAAQTTEVPEILLSENAQRLQEVVVIGSNNQYNAEQPSTTLRIQTPLIEVPQNIQVVNKQVIADQQIISMVEGVTRNVSGASRVEHWDNVYARIYMRGSNIPGFRNGMNISMPFGPMNEDMSMIERIEFVKGPAGFMMANGEPGGFYNVVTKKPTGRNKGEVNFMLGSFNTFRTALDLDGKLSKDGKVLYRLNLMGQKRGSNVDYDYNNRVSVAPVISYRVSDNTTLTAEYTYQNSKFLQPAGYAFSNKGYADVPVNFQAADPSMLPGNINDNSLFLTLNHRFNSHWSFTAQMAYITNKNINYNIWPDATIGIDSMNNLSRELWVWDSYSENKLAQVFVNGDFTTGTLKHRVLAGLDMGDKQYYGDFSTLGYLPSLNIYNPTYGLSAADVPAYDFSTPLKQRANYIDKLSYTAIYVQDEISFLRDKIRLTVAGRYTNSNTNDVQDNVVTPRVGLSATLVENLAVYALYDQSYVPQIGKDFNNKAFKPVMGNNIEAGVKKDWFNKRFSSSLSVYRITSNNVLTTDPEHPSFSKQIGQVQTQGVEVDLKGELLPGLNVVINYAYTDSKVTEDTNPLNVGTTTPGTATHLQNTWLSYHLPSGLLKGFGASIGYQYQIDRHSWYVFDGSEKALPDYFRLDGGLSWQNAKFSCNLLVNNLLNTYLYSGFPPSSPGSFYTWIAEPKTNFRISFGYKF